jgi:RNA polymerase sigma factor (sigma-70 family)
MGISEDSTRVTHRDDRLMDLDDFECLYDTNAEVILRFFFRRTGSADTAAELTAETFAAALGSLDSFEPSSGSPRQWLFGIARHQLSRFLRWRRVDSKARKRLGMRPAVDLDAESRDRIEDLADLRETLGRLDEALEMLTPKVAQAVELRVSHDLSYRQVADRLGISEAAARARVSRGLSQLADAFEVES